MKSAASTYIWIFITTGLLAACSETPSPSDNDNQTAGTPDTPAQNKFEIAATMKIMAANPGLAKEKASCVVKSIIADGKIGLGEINQMRLTKGAMDNNRDDLNQAYLSALKKCQ